MRTNHSIDKSIQPIIDQTFVCQVWNRSHDQQIDPSNQHGNQIVNQSTFGVAAATASTFGVAATTAFGVFGLR